MITINAFVDQHSIVVAHEGKTIMIARQDPAFDPVREYLLVEEGQDFDAVRSIVYFSRSLIETFGWSEEGSEVPWNDQVPPSKFDTK